MLFTYKKLQLKPSQLKKKNSKLKTIYIKLFKNSTKKQKVNDKLLDNMTSLAYMFVLIYQCYISKAFCSIAKA